MGSTRLPGKVLLLLDGMTLLERAWRTASEAFGSNHVIIAHPDTPENQPIASHASAMGAQSFAWKGHEDDVLGRFHACAHTYRWRAESVIVRYTPDDPFKTVEGLRRVAEGERLPVEIGGEAFTLEMLDDALDRWTMKTTQRPLPSGYKKRGREVREHISLALFAEPAPPAPSGKIWTIDTSEDLDAAKARATRERNAPAKI